MDITNMTSDLETLIVTRETRQPGNYEVLRSTLRKKEAEGSREKRDLITLASLHLKFSSTGTCLKSLDSQSEMTVKYLEGGAWLAEVRQ